MGLAEAFTILSHLYLFSFLPYLTIIPFTRSLIIWSTFLRFFTLVLFSFLLQNSLSAQTLSIESISNNIKHSLPRTIKGQNKTIIENIYAQSGYQPLWIGKKNKNKTSRFIQALNDPLFNYKNKSFDQSSIKRLFYLLDNNEVSQKKQAAVYARLDLILTSSMVRLVRFIVQGDVDWDLVQKKMAALEESDDISAHWEMSPKPFPDQKKLLAA